MSRLIFTCLSVAIPNNGVNGLRSCTGKNGHSAGCNNTACSHYRL
jgi:hypothetical protein